MQLTHRVFAVTALSAALLSLVAYASQSAPARSDAIDRNSADLLPSAAKRSLAVTARGALPAGLVTTNAAPTLDDVGDVDSFGRNVTWLGVTQAEVDIADACPIIGADPAAACFVPNAAPATTTFAYNDLARIALPAKATNSLLCHWFSPFLTVDFYNPGASPVVARLRYSPTLTIENPVLADPSLIDLTTGLPFNGKLLTGMTSTETYDVPLAAGQQLTERYRDTATCIAGFITKRALTDTYGLTEAQAKQFFKKPTTIRMNISGSVQYVQDANLIFGLRVVGD